MDFCVRKIVGIFGDVGFIVHVVVLVIYVLICWIVCVVVVRIIKIGFGGFVFVFIIVFCGGAVVRFCVFIGCVCWWYICGGFCVRIICHCIGGFIVICVGIFVREEEGKG